MTEIISRSMAIYSDKDTNTIAGMYKVETGDQGFILEKIVGFSVEVLTLDFPTSSLVLTKNGRNYKTNTNNLNKFFAVVEKEYDKKPTETQKEFLKFLSPPSYPNMYLDLFEYLGDYHEKSAREYAHSHFRLSRLFTNLMTDQFIQLEVLYKANVFSNLGIIGNSPSSRIRSCEEVRKLLTNAKENNLTKPHEILQLTSYQFNFLTWTVENIEGCFFRIYDSLNFLRSLREESLNRIRDLLSFIYIENAGYNLTSKEKKDLPKRLRPSIFFNHFYHNEKYEGRIIKKKELPDYINLDILDVELGDFKYFSSGNGYISYSTFTLAQEYNLNIRRLIKYICFDIYYDQYLEDLIDSLMLLRDYLRSLDLLEIDRKGRVYTPNLMEDHDIWTGKYKAGETKEYRRKYEEQVNKEPYRRLEYKPEEEKFNVIIPEKISEITREGSALGHCVGTYVERIIDGKTKILFLRNVNDLERPLVTIEISPSNEIVQARGRSNRDLKVEEKNFVKKYAENKQLKVSKYL